MWFSCICSSIRSFAKPVHLVTLLWLFSVMHWFNILVKCFANLYAGAVLFLIIGQIGISVLCNFSWAMRTAGKGFFCVMTLSAVCLRLIYIPSLLFFVSFFGTHQWGPCSVCWNYWLRWKGGLFQRILLNL